LLPAVRSFDRTGGVLILVKVAVYIDWQNAYKTAREAFGLEAMPNEHGNFDPYQLAQILAAGNGRDADAELTRVEIHRGLPSQKHDPTGYAANRRQSAAWMKGKLEIVIPRLRPLRYPANYPDEPAVEKGVDVQLALGAVEGVLMQECDVAIIFSHDSDLLPVPETISRLASTHNVETASWESPTFKKRLRPKPAVFHHDLDESVFRRVETAVNYAFKD
jgi:uncharacterized LabA/DUF88 family protein